MYILACHIRGPRVVKSAVGKSESMHDTGDCRMFATGLEMHQIIEAN